MARVVRTAGVALVLVFASLTSVHIQGQKWVVPRTADGRPDLQGVWENNSATPLERPRQLADKPRLSDEELESMKRLAATLFGPDAEATFGDALYQTLLANTTPRGLGCDWLVQPELAARSLLRAPDFADRRSGRRETAAANAGRSQAPCRGARTVRTGRRLGPGAVAPGSLHSLWLPGSVRRIHGRLPHRADAGVRGDPDGEDPRRPHHPARWSSARILRVAQLPRRLARASGKATRSSSKPRTSIRRAIRWAATPRCRTRTSGSSSASAASPTTPSSTRSPSTTPPCGRNRGRP